MDPTPPDAPYPRRDPPWSVFVSRTTAVARAGEDGRTYLDAAIEAIMAQGHRVVDQTVFPTTNTPGSRESSDAVRRCDVYLGLLGHHPGSVVPDDPQGRTYCELEFDTAGEAGIPRLVFPLKREVDGPVNDADRQRQEDFRTRARTGRVAPPAENLWNLVTLVERGLTDLARKRREATEHEDDAPYLLPEPDESDVRRPDMVAELTQELTWTPTAQQTAARIVVLHGPAGVGKSSLAKAVCNQEVIKARYPGGILWTTLGEGLDAGQLAGKVVGFCRNLGLTAAAAADPEEAGYLLASRLRGRRRPTLLVVDGPVAAAQVAPFVQSRAAVTCLVITRDRAVAPGGPLVRVEMMSRDQARSVLLRGLGDIAPPALDRLLAIAGGLPLVLGLANSALVDDVRRKIPADEAVRMLVEHLEVHGVVGIEAVGVLLDASLDRLSDEQRRRYRELRIFPPGKEIPISVLSLLWRRTESLTDKRIVDLCGTFDDRSLASYEPKRGCLSIHAVMGDYLARAVPAETEHAVHTTMVDAAAELVPAGDDGGPRQWWRLLPDSEYLRQNIVRHLHAAGLHDELAALVHDVRWMTFRLRHDGPAALDVDLSYDDQPVTVTLQQAIAQNSDLLTAPTPSSSLDSILHARLAGYPGLRPLLDAQPLDRSAPRMTVAWPLPDQPDPALRRTFAALQRAVESIAIDRTEYWLATASGDAAVLRWDADRGTQLDEIAFPGEVTRAVIDPNGAWIAGAGGDRDVRIWDRGTQTLSHVLPDHVGGVTAVAVAAWAAATPKIPASTAASSGSGTSVSVAASAWPVESATLLVTAARNLRVRMWNMTDVARGAARAPAEILELGGYSVPVTGLACNAAGDLVATALQDGRIWLWRLTSDDVGNTPAAERIRAEREQVFEAGETVTALVFDPLDRWIASAGPSGIVRIWDPGSGELREELDEQGPINGLAVGPAGEWLASAGEDQTIRIWDPADWTMRRTLAGHTGPVLGIAVEPRGGWLASASGDRTIRIWETAVTAELPVDGRANTVPIGVAINGDGTRLTTVAEDGTVRIHDVADGGLRRILPGEGTAEPMVRISADGTRILIVDAEGVRVLDVDGERHRILEHTELVHGVAFGADPTQVITVSGTQAAVLLWDTPSASARLATPRYPTWVDAMAVAPDASWAALANSDVLLDGRDVGVVRRWSLHSDSQYSTGQEPLLRIENERIVDLAVSSDGGRIITASTDDRVSSWDAVTGDLQWSVNRRWESEPVVAVSPDDGWLATVGGSAPLELWDLATGEPLIQMPVADRLTRVAAGPDGLVAAIGRSGVFLFRYQAQDEASK